jgi:hypothetical protein
MQGLNVRQIIERTQRDVKELGFPVISAGQGTVELLDYSFVVAYHDRINLDDIRSEMNDYYKDKNLNLDEIEQLEENEYKLIEETLLAKFPLFDEDIHSRRVLWTNDCCISMIHYLIRDKVIYCYLHLRSSDVIYKLFSDLFLIHKITRQLQDKLNIDSVSILVNAHSIHEVVIKDINQVNLKED